MLEQVAIPIVPHFLGLAAPAITDAPTGPAIVLGLIMVAATGASIARGIAVHACVASKHLQQYESDHVEAAPGDEE